MQDQEVVEIDGSQLEGGGQILRISSSLSAILGVTLKIVKIRGGRPKPGLAAQHLAGLQLIKSLTRAKFTGGHITSNEIELCPQKIIGGSFEADTKTAGSVCLLIQSILPICLFGNQQTTFTLRGGTDADMAPPIDYTIKVFSKIVEKFGVKYNIILNKRGFFPRGGGEVILEVKPIVEPLKPISLVDRGKVIAIRGCSFVAGVLPIKMAHLMADNAKKLLETEFGPNLKLEITRYKEDDRKAFGTGSSICLWAETSTGCTIGSNALGRKGRTPEDIGLTAARELIEDIKSGSCVDRHAQNQIIMFMALAKGKSQVRTMKLSLHTITAIHMVEQVAKVKFSITEEPATNTVLMECDGMGIKA